jgi:hypothetical protein
LPDYLLHRGQINNKQGTSPFTIRSYPLTDLRTLIFKRANAIGLSQKDAMTITKNLGMLLLAVYLILAGITLLFHITIPTIVMGILALAAGILILIGR